MQKIDDAQIFGEIIALLKQHPVFSELGDERIKELASMPDVEAGVFLRGDTVVKQGDDDRRFFLVARGELAAYFEKENEPKRLLNYLEPGTFFGFRNLLDRHHKRDATVEAVVDSLVVIFSQKEWEWLEREHPQIKEGLHSLEKSFDEQAKLGFSGKQADEVTILIARRHFLAFFSRLTLPLVLLTIPVIFFLIVELLGVSTLFSADGVFFWVLTLPFVAASLLVTLYHYIDWRNDELILTSKRIIHIERILFYSEERREAPLTQIQSVTVQSHNWLDLIFDVDDIQIQTAAIGKIFVDNLRSAQIISRRILSAQHAAKQRVAAFNKAKTRQQIHDRLQKTILVDELPPPPEPQVVRRKFKPKALLPKVNYGYYMPRVKEIQDKKITWRKHPLILTKNIFLPALSILASLYLLLASFFALWPFSTPAHWLVKSAFGLALFLSWFWYTHRYDAWRRDVYILTDTKIIDVESSAFRLRGEHVREGSFDSIQNITYNIPSWWEQLINLGDVTIKTAAIGDFSFKRVFNPSSVQETIFYRWDRFQDQKQQRVQEATNSQVIEIVGLYDEEVTQRKSS
ncbi:MAG: hypothetical protein Kow0031_07290 [Anaerolineae bacterium]